MGNEHQSESRWTSYDHAIFDLLDAASDLRPDGRLIEGGKHGLGVVGLMGPTQCGKTTLVQEWARGRGLELVTSYIGCDDSVDVAGWPVRSKDTGGSPTLEFTNPSIIPARFIEDRQYDGRWVLLLDELEKADAATISPILSLLAERKLRDKLLHMAAIVVCANEPKRPLHEAVSARLIWCPYPGEAYPILEREHLKPLARYFEPLQPTMKCSSWPERRTTPGSLHRIAQWAQTRRVFWTNEQVQDLILNGSLSERDADVVRAKFRDIPTSPALDWARDATPSEVSAGMLYYLTASDKATSQRLQEILAKRAAEDETGEMALVLDAFYGSRKPISPLAALEPHDGESKLERDQRLKTGSKFLLRKYQTASRKAAKERAKSND